MVYHGKLVAPDGRAMTGTGEVTLKVYSPEPKFCLLWAEKQTLTLDNGGFSVEIGHSSNRISGSGGGAALDFKQTFTNHPGLNISGAACEDGTSYTPSANDDRLLEAHFNIAGVAIEVANLPIKSVPFALQAAELGGYSSAHFAKISGAGSNVTYTPEEAQSLKDLLGGDLNWNLKARRLEQVAAPLAASDAATKGYVDTTDSATRAWVSGQISASGGGTVMNVTGTAPINVSSGSTSPVVSIQQAGTSQSGYLSASDWNVFNSKQPAGAYLTSITSNNVTAALGFTPADSGSSIFTNAVINGGNTGTVTVGTNDATALQFETANTQRMTIAASGNIGIGTTTPLSRLDLGRISADDDGEILYGQYLRADGGSVIPTTGSRKAYGQNIEVDGGPGYDSGWNYSTGATGSLYKLRTNSDLLTSGDTTGISIMNFDNYLTDYSGDNQNPVGVYVGFNIGGTAGWSSSFLSSVTIEPEGTPISQTATSYHGRIYKSGVSDVYRGLLIEDPVDAWISGGTAYGAYINLGAGGFTNRYGIYEAGGAKNYFSGNVGIGTTSPGDKLHVEGKIRAQEICDENGANCKDISGGWTAGSVTTVGVGGLPLTVTNASTTPQISIVQAGAAQAGYLSSTDWTLFNSKQAAGNYLTSIAAADVNTALGFTPTSNILPAGQVYVGNGSNVATAGFFGIAQMKNNVGTSQFPSACAASQTLTWSAITDVLSCTNIGSLPASAITTGTIDSSRLPFSASLWQDGGSGKVYYNGGNVGIGTTSPQAPLQIYNNSNFGFPASSGSGVGANSKLAVSAADVSINMGINADGISWLQTQRISDLSNTFSFILNPNGGNVGIGTTTPGQRLSVAGTIESTSGGIKFPDGSTQTTAATGGSNGPTVLNAIRVYTSTAIWNKPANFAYAQVKLWGGGGGGSRTGPGGAGGYSEKVISTSLISAVSSVTVTIGGGGAGAACATGGSGGNTSFGAYFSSGGGGGAPDGVAGAGGAGSGGDINVTGDTGELLGGTTYPPRHDEARSGSSRYGRGGASGGDWNCTLVGQPGTQGFALIYEYVIP